jgi:CelD/BcsL family acetyltransferase involved in cellulose biosynthesis
MLVTCHTTFAELAPHATRWNEFARGVPFRRWEWLESWWRHYGLDGHQPSSEKQLLLLAVHERDELVGIAPWYSHRSWSDGRTIRWLGSGEVCSEYLSLLCSPNFEDRVAETLAAWLTDRSESAADVGGTAWDLLELGGIERQDRAILRLANHLEAAGNSVHIRPGVNCWRIALPSQWDEFLVQLSKSHRKQIRRADQRLFKSGRVSVHRASGEGQLTRAFDILAELHQRRWESLGKSGCFRSSRFLAFHREVVSRLFIVGAADVFWLECDGSPIAAEYHLIGDRTVYAYQSGIAPDRLDLEPGRLAVLATIKQAIDEGHQCYDFLRGDEPYKAHWRANPRATLEVQVVPPRASARIRRGVITASQGVKSWIKQGLELARLR